MFTTFIIFASTIETLIEKIKLVLPADFKYSKLVAHLLPLLLGIAGAFAFRIDFTQELIGMAPLNSTLGYLWTGLLAGLGSSAAHDVIDIARKLKPGVKAFLELVAKIEK